MTIENWIQSMNRCTGPVENLGKSLLQTLEPRNVHVADARKCSPLDMGNGDRSAEKPEKMPEEELQLANRRRMRREANAAARARRHARDGTGGLWEAIVKVLPPGPDANGRGMPTSEVARLLGQEILSLKATLGHMRRDGCIVGTKIKKSFEWWRAPREEKS
jgi:hypothetical protein